jgi:site-specific DNA-methyltransferase (adenine-specific)
MNPYYEHAGITIYHGDCREILPQLPKVDLILTDPPYGVGMMSFTDDFSIVPGSINSCDADLAAVFTSPKRIFELCKAIESQWRFQRILTMHKIADISYPWHGWMMNSESILLFDKPHSLWPKQRECRSDVYRVGPWERTGHPNGKPLDVIVDLVYRLSNTSNKILDPFMGSGTTLVAAKQLGRKAIGIEIEERYVEIACKRLSQEVLPLCGDMSLLPQKAKDTDREPFSGLFDVRG